MGGVVGDVAAGRTEVDGHAAIVADGENVEQLLEVGAMVFAVAPGDGQRLLVAALPGLGGLGVGAEERDRGGVVVQFIETEVELLDDMADERQEERRPVAVEEEGQAAAHAVVVEGADVLGREVQQRRMVAGGPLTQAIERFSGQQQVLEENEETLGRWQFGTPIGARQMGLQECVQVESLQEVVEDGQEPDRAGSQGSLLQASDGPQARLLRAACGLFLWLGHRQLRCCRGRAVRCHTGRPDRTAAAGSATRIATCPGRSRGQKKKNHFGPVPRTCPSTPGKFRTAGGGDGGQGHRGCEGYAKFRIGFRRVRTTGDLVGTGTKWSESRGWGANGHLSKENGPGNNMIEATP